MLHIFIYSCLELTYLCSYYFIAHTHTYYLFDLSFCNVSERKIIKQEDLANCEYIKRWKKTTITSQISCFIICIDPIEALHR